MTETVSVTAPVVGGKPPGPRGLQLVRTLLSYRRAPLPTLEKLAAEYGDVTYFPLPGAGGYLLSHPDFVHQVLIGNPDNYIKATTSAHARHFFGNAMQLTNGDGARAIRRIVAPAFHGESLLRAYGQLIVDDTNAAADAWPAGPRPAFTQELIDLVLGIVVRMFFGTARGAETTRVGKLLVDALPPEGAMLPAWLPGSRNRRYVEAAAALDAEMMRMIAERRLNPGAATDFLSTLLRAANKEGVTLTDRQVRDEIVVYSLSGYSASTGVNQALRLLAENPAAEQTLAAELSGVIGARDPEVQDLPRLDYLSKVIKEALRICSPAGVMYRSAVKADNVGGWTIPAGARVFVASWVMQRDARFFDAPMEFRPERWTPDFERQLPACAYFPFGRGPRACIGGAMGELIVKLVVATIVKRHRLTADVKLPDDQVEWSAILASGGIRATLHPRVA